MATSWFTILSISSKVNITQRRCKDGWLHNNWVLDGLGYIMIYYYLKVPKVCGFGWSSLLTANLSTAPPTWNLPVFVVWNPFLVKTSHFAQNICDFPIAKSPSVRRWHPRFRCPDWIDCISSVSCSCLKPCQPQLGRISMRDQLWAKLSAGFEMVWIWWSEYCLLFFIYRSPFWAEMTGVSSIDETQDSGSSSCCTGNGLGTQPAFLKNNVYNLQERLPIELSRETRSWRGMIGIWSLCRSPMVGDSSVETTATQHCSHNLTRLFRTSAWRGYPNESHPTHHNCCITQVNWPMLFVHLYYPPFIYNTFIHFHTLPLF